MPLFANLLDPILRREPANTSLENPAVSLDDADAWAQVMGSSKAQSDIVVTHDNALSSSAVWQAVSLISGDLGSMPLNLYKERDDDGRDIYSQGTLNFLISKQPNQELTAQKLWRRCAAHALLWGNGYLYIKREKRITGPPLELYNLLPDRTMPKVIDGELMYITEVSDGNNQTHIETLFPEEVFHLEGMAVDNSRGLDLVANAKEAIGLALAAQGYGSKFFANGAATGGILEVPATFEKQAADNLEEGWSKRASGKDNWFKTAILRDGAKFHATTLDARRSQLIETRDHQVAEVARYYNLSPVKLGIDAGVPYKGIDEIQRIYLIGTLFHWMVGLTQEAECKFLSRRQKESGKFTIEFNIAKLIEPDVKTLNEVLTMQRQNMVITANEYRDRINMNPIDDPNADILLNPSTTSSGDDEKEEDEDQEEDNEVIEEEDNDDSDDDSNKNQVGNVVNPHIPLMSETLDRVSKRCYQSLQRRIKGSLTNLDAITSSNDFSKEGDTFTIVCNSACASVESSLGSPRDSTLHDLLKSEMVDALKQSCAQISVEINYDTATVEVDQKLLNESASTTQRMITTFTNTYEGK